MYFRQLPEVMCLWTFAEGKVSVCLLNGGFFARKNVFLNFDNAYSRTKQKDFKRISKGFQMVKQLGMLEDWVLVKKQGGTIREE